MRIHFQEDLCELQACPSKEEQLQDHSNESQRLLLKLQQLKLRATSNVQARLTSRDIRIQGCKRSFHGKDTTSENWHLCGSLHLFKGCHTLFMHAHQCLERSQSVHQTLNELMQVKARPKIVFTNILGRLPSICWSFGRNCIPVCTGRCKVREIPGKTSRVHPTIAC